MPQKHTICTSTPYTSKYILYKQQTISISIIRRHAQHLNTARSFIYFSTCFGHSTWGKVHNRKITLCWSLSFTITLCRRSLLHNYAMSEASPSQLRYVGGLSFTITLCWSLSFTITPCRRPLLHNYAMSEASPSQLHYVGGLSFTITLCRSLSFTITLCRRPLLRNYAMSEASPSQLRYVGASPSQLR
jgi:hypothetical protein